MRAGRSRAEVIEDQKMPVQPGDLQNSRDGCLQCHQRERAADQSGSPVGIDEDGGAAGVNESQLGQVEDEAARPTAIQDVEQPFTQVRRARKVEFAAKLDNRAPLRRALDDGQVHSHGLLVSLG